MPNKFYLTTPIYYVNARPHIGHAYTTIVADVLARRHRLLQEDVFFLTGTDEHGQKIERSAAAAGIPPQQFADEVSAKFRTLWDRMGLTYDRYIRTTSPEHIRGVQHLFTELHKRGHIYLSSYTGQYSIGEEMFVEGPPGTIGPDGKPTETVTEENFFFRLSDFQLPLLNLIESNELKITPDSARNEVLSFLRGKFSPVYSSEEAVHESEVDEDSYAAAITGRTAAGNLYMPGALKDLSVSRSSFTWGIPVPEPAASETQQKHVIYVWLDALANYMTAIGYGAEGFEAPDSEFNRYWPADLHLVGKEITRFHCVYWPAFLMAAGLPTPKAITANGWLLFDNAKMSKSRGNVVRTETILEAFGTLCPPVPNPKPLSFRSAAEESAFPPGTPQSSGEAHQPQSPLPASMQAGNDQTAPHQDAGTDRKGTASAVPITTAPDAALAAEVRPPTQAERDLFATDILRYHLLREIPFGQDGSFSFDAMITRYNADLANGYGNLVSRTLKMISQYCNGSIPQCQFTTAPFGDGDTFEVEFNRIQSKIYDAAVELRKLISTNNLTGATEKASGLVSLTDQFLTVWAPWKLVDASQFELRANYLYTAAESIRIITALLYPILPYATARVWAQLGLGDIEQAAANGDLKNLTWGGLKPGTKIGPLAPIFPRADKGLAQIMIDMEEQKPVTGNSKLETESKTPPPTTDPAAAPRTASLDEPSGTLTVAGSHAQTTGPDPTLTTGNGQLTTPADASPQITIDDFIKIELRVAQVLVCERIPKADKLLRLEVDLGYEKLQILSGIAEWYTPEDMLGRRIIVITNLAPRKMRGLESHGMLLAASEEGGKPYLATVPEGVPVGTRLK